MLNLTRIHLLLDVFEHNSNLNGPVILLKRMTSGVWSVGDISRIHQGCSKGFTVRDVSFGHDSSDLWFILLRKWIQPFCGPTIPRTRIGRGLWWESRIRSLRIFSKFSVINVFDMPLATTVWVRLAMLFPSAWWVIEDFVLGLEANVFL